uniref:Uncharacterized protein n=1 Tax=Rhizophora mucronata TaxID=61149 RepID=A0A2P2QHZ0_RHIMU
MVSHLKLVSYVLLVISKVHSEFLFKDKDSCILFHNGSYCYGF